MKTRLANLGVDLSILLSIWMGIGLLSAILAWPTYDYLRVNLVMAVFLLPGWCASHFIVEHKNHFLNRLFWAGVFSLILYTALALVCRTCSLGFDAFYVLFGVATLGTVGIAIFRSDAYKNGFRLRFPTILQLVAGAALLAMLILVYRAPHANDLSEFVGQMADTLRQRDFRVSTFGMECFDIQEPMPRWKANLFHAFIAVVADASGISSVSVSEYLLTIPLGLLMVLAMCYFIRLVAGQSIPWPIIILSFMAPVTLFWRPQAAPDPYDYSYRLLNSPCVDKDFALFFILPSCLCLAILYIRSGTSRYWVGLTALILLSNFLHSMVAIYFLMSVGVLVVAYGRPYWRRLAMIAAVAVCALAWGIFLGYAASHHDAMSTLVLHDFQQTGGKSHWSGQYVTIPNCPVSASPTITWFHGFMILRPELFLSNSLIFYSFLAMAVWAFILAWHRRRGWTIADDERTAFRLQLGFMGIVVAIFAFAPLFFLLSPHLWRGYDRLHWMYFGFFPFVFLMKHAWKMCREWLGESPLRLTAVRAMGYAFLAFHATDHCLTLRLHRQTWLESAIPVVHSRIGFHESTHARYILYRITKDSWRATQQPERRKFFFVKPDWLHPDDRVLNLEPWSTPRYKAMWYWISKQSVHWDRLFTEAFAYVKRGPSFLEDCDAYRDARNWQVTDRLVRYLRRKKVTLIITEVPPLFNETMNSFLHRLSEKAGASLTPLEPGVYRLRLP